MLDPRLAHAVAVAREGSFTRAAALMGITQPAITRSIADLEKRLGYPLFSRTARGAVLTIEGRTFVERAARILDDASALLTEAPNRDPYAGVLHIAVCPASVEWVLAKPVEVLLRRHPTIKLEIMGGKFETTVHSLRTGAVDVAVGFEAAFKEWPDLTCTPIAPIQPFSFVRVGHPLLSKAVITSEDLARYDTVAPSDSRPYGASIREFYEKQSINWRDRVHVVDSFQIVRKIVAVTDAMGMVAEGSVGTLGRGFRVLENAIFVRAAAMACATRDRWPPRPAAKAFIQIMRELLPAQP